VQLSDGALGVSRWERLNRRERTRQLLAGGVVLSEGVPAAAAATTPFSRRGGEESVHAFLARPPDHPYEVAGRETYYTRFRGSLRRHCYTPAVHDTVAGHPPPVKRWRRRWRSLLQGALGKRGGGGGSSGGRVKRSRARLTGTRGGGGGSAAGGRAGETPPPRDWLGVRARSIRETIPLSPPSLPRLSHIPAHHPTVITALYTFFLNICVLFFSRYFPKPADRLTEQPLLFYT